MPRNRGRGGSGGWRDIITQRMMQQQSAAPQQMPQQMPQMPMGGSGDKPMPAGAGLGSMGLAPQQQPMAGGMPAPYAPNNEAWMNVTGHAAPVDNYTPYAGAGSLSSPGGMNMASLNAPYQAPAMPQTTGGPPLFPTGGR